MQRSINYLLIGSLLSFLINHYLFVSQGWKLDLYYGFAFGLGWGLAYFVDHPEWDLAKKMGISLIGVAILILLGILFFDFQTAIPSVIKFSTVFVAYYLVASFKERKSLRK